MAKVLVESRMIIRQGEIYAKPTRNVNDHVFPYKHRDLTTDEVKSIPWENTTFYTFAPYLIVTYEKNAVWYMKETTMIKENALMLWEKIRFKMDEERRLALMMAFHKRLGEKSLLGLLDIDLVKDLALK